MFNTKKLLVRVASTLLAPLVLSFVPYLILVQLGIDVALGLIASAFYWLLGFLYFLARDYLPAALSLSISMFLLGLWAWGLAILAFTAGMWLLSLYFRILQY